jgi:hypothetical protein
MNINISKTKEMLIGKANCIPDLLSANDCGFIERVTVFKLLGVHFNSNLNWNDHVSSICSKANSRLYFLKHLKRSGIDTEDLLFFYTTTIVPILEYCCAVWHTSLTREQSDHIESSQKRAFSIIFGFSLRGIYLDFCRANDFLTLAERRELYCRKFFEKSVIAPSSFLHYLLPDKMDKDIVAKLRRKCCYNILPARTTKFRNSFIMYSLDHYL